MPTATAPARSRVALEQTGARSARLRRHRGGGRAARRRRPRRDPRLRRAQRQRSRWPVRLPAHADHLDAGSGAGRPGGRRALQAPASLSPEDRHRHEPARLPLRQPARARCPNCWPATEPSSSTRSTRTSRPPMCPIRRCSSSSGCASSARWRCRAPRRPIRVIVTPRTARRCCATRASGSTASVPGSAAVRHRAAAAGVDRCRLTPVMTLTSRVVAVKGLRPGEITGYGARFVAERPTTHRDRAGGICRRSRPAARRPRRRPDSRSARADRRFGLHGHADGRRDGHRGVAR